MKKAIEIAKKNLVSIICGVVVLIALFAKYVIPIPGLFEDLRTKAQARATVYSSMDSLIKSTPSLPKIDPSQVDDQPLGFFPTAPVIKQAQDAVAAMKAQTKSLLDNAVQLNRRKPLVPDALPIPRGQNVTRQQFLNAYKIELNVEGRTYDRSIFGRILQSTSPPTDLELRMLEAGVETKVRKDRTQFDDAFKVLNQKEVEGLVTAAKLAALTGERFRRATSFRVYVSPGAIQPHPAMIGIDVPNDVSIFNAQLSLWQQQILCEAIVTANQGSKNVLDAPIKHIVVMNVEHSVAVVQTAAAQPGATPDAAPAVDAPLSVDASLPITKSYAQLPFGQVSNSLYDPITTTLVLRVDARKVPQVIASLASNRLLVVQNVNLNSIDPGLARQAGFLYGDSPVIELRLDVTLLFLRPWLAEFMNADVQRYFAALANPAAPAG